MFLPAAAIRRCSFFRQSAETPNLKPVFSAIHTFSTALSTKVVDLPGNPLRHDESSQLMLHAAGGNGRKGIKPDANRIGDRG